MNWDNQRSSWLEENNQRAAFLSSVSPVGFSVVTGEEVQEPLGAAEPRLNPSAQTAWPLNCTPRGCWRELSWACPPALPLTSSASLDLEKRKPESNMEAQRSASGGWGRSPPHPRRPASTSAGPTESGRGRTADRRALISAERLPDEPAAPTGCRVAGELRPHRLKERTEPNFFMFRWK